MTFNFRLAVAAALVGTTTGAWGQAVTDFVNYQAGTYVQTFDTLPNPGATSINTAQVVVINGITYTLPLANAVPYALDDPTIGSGGNSIGGPTMAGWYGGDLLLDRFGATFGDQTSGRLLDFGPAGGSNRALGLIATEHHGGQLPGGCDQERHRIHDHGGEHRAFWANSGSKGPMPRPSFIPIRSITRPPRTCFPRRPRRPQSCWDR